MVMKPRRSWTAESSDGGGQCGEISPVSRASASRPGSRSARPRRLVGASQPRRADGGQVRTALPGQRRYAFRWRTNEVLRDINRQRAHGMPRMGVNGTRELMKATLTAEQRDFASSSRALLAAECPRWCARWRARRRPDYAGAVEGIGGSRGIRLLSPRSMAAPVVA